MEIKTKDSFRIKIIGIIFNPEKREIMIGKKCDEKFWNFLETELTYKDNMDKKLKEAIKEKTGYNVKNLGAVFSKKDSEQEDLIEIYFLCEIFEGKEKKGPGIEEIKWIKPAHTERYLNEKLPTRLKGYLSNLE